ncbi:radical SAM protein [Tepidibacillus sp. LV47]|uniref:radical SAM protein n=1 Tax=Tepidibacillus sp. LV47 TaxID=3398228 RepID=UPI003AAA43B8
MDSMKRYVPSRFNAIAHTDNNGLVLYNSYTGAIASFSEEEKGEILLALKREGIKGELSDPLKRLVESGFLVPDHVNEDMRAKFLHQSLHRTDQMHLVLFPTEECNFRCTYCYETFPRGKMDDDTIEGLKKYVEQNASRLNLLSISWLGGEPLLAIDVIEELSKSFLDTVEKYGIDYTADISTNGYFLTDDVFKKLLNWKIRRFMITIDGLEPIHDQRRHLLGGGKTFSRIIDHLKNIKDSNEEFEITIRVNFDENNLPAMPELISFLSEHFSEDKRFGIFFRPVGRWGGVNDDQIPVCMNGRRDEKIWELTKLSLEKGLKMSSIIENSLLPTGSVCYAAKPYSLVVGSNGKLYKCSIAFEDEKNQIGQIYRDGSIKIDYDKFAFWVTSGEENDSVCQSCFYRPACQGNHCPLYRMRTGLRPCSYEKRRIKKVLNLIWKSYIS